MNKKIFPVIMLLAFIISVFLSCKDNDDDINFDYEWRDKNDRIFMEYYDNGDYNVLKSPLSVYEPSENSTGYPVHNIILWKKSNIITNSDLSPRITATGKPLFTDSVHCRYDAWYFDKTDKKILFASTERPIAEGYPDPNKTEGKFTLSSSSSTYLILTEGVRTALQDMVVGEEREIITPWRLGYGQFGYSPIPGFTNIFVNIKLTKIISTAEVE